MSTKESLRGLYVISDDELTPKESLLSSIELALEGGAKVVQLRDKVSNDQSLIDTIFNIQALCHQHHALFVLNDRVELAIELKCDGLHIGKSDHYRFADIRKKFKGILGVSCYGDWVMARQMELMGADYVAFGSFFASPTKPNSNIVDCEVLRYAKERLTIPICAIGGINSQNVETIMEYQPDMVAVISDIWNNDIKQQAKLYTNFYKGASK